MSIFCRHKWFDIFISAGTNIFGVTFMSIKGQCGKCGAVRELLDAGSCYEYNYCKHLPRLKEKCEKLKKFYKII